MGQKVKSLTKLVILTPIIVVLVLSVSMFILGYTAYFSIIYTLSVILLLASSFAVYKKMNEYIKFTKIKENELIRKNSILKKQFFTDGLTKLNNLKKFDEDIKKIRFPKVILLNIDSFKDINEFYGKKNGDIVLIKISKLILEFAKKHGMQAYRIGSDEFAILDSNELDIDKYENIAVELVESFKTKEILLNEQKDMLIISSTIGFSLESEDTFRKALTALKFAKKHQKDFACYIHSMDTKDEYHKKLKHIKLIKNALDNDQLLPFFQPIVNRNGEIIKYEALSRIIDGENIVSPGAFMGTSKKVRLYSLMAKRVIDKSLKKISTTNKTISINLLPRDMMDSDINIAIQEQTKAY